MKTPGTYILATALCLTAALALAQDPARPPKMRAQRPPMHPQNVPPNPGPRRFGDPLGGLTMAENALFGAGREEFENVETVESGLGPVFNDVSCVACHSSRAAGGASAITVTRFGRMVKGEFDPMTEFGGSLLQAHAIDPAAQEVLPAEANVVARRQATPLFGLGLVEAIPDETIRQLATRRPGDGIHGRAAMVMDPTTGTMRVGRFGWKAQDASLLEFAGDAYVNELGVTNRYFPTENAPNGDPALLERFDLTEDPEDVVDPATGRSDIDAAADFIRFLAPPPPMPLTRPAEAGRALFSKINCTGCHVPSLGTGPSPVAALRHRPVPLYSDLLLHDMGSLADGIAQGDADTREMRTAPLWGLRASGPYLHDGRAATVDEAIREHEGEATISRDRYLKLSPMQKGQLAAFLNSL